MARNKNDYFKLTEAQAAYCVQAAELLIEIFRNYKWEKIAEQKYNMHLIENRADDLRHDILTGLTREFITPIDQEDILRLVQIIDDVTDALDEVVQNLYMFRVEEIPDYAPALADVVERCVHALLEAVREVKNFKKPEKLRALLVEVNAMESEADGVYVEAVHVLFGNKSAGRILLGHKAVYDSLEQCCDLCEHAADVMEQIVIKNT
jgi:predicted phosphate transport protein (TIGR00153 family)